MRDPLFVFGEAGRNATMMMMHKPTSRGEPAFNGRNAPPQGLKIVVQSAHVPWSFRSPRPGARTRSGSAIASHGLTARRRDVSSYPRAARQIHSFFHSLTRRRPRRLFLSQWSLIAEYTVCGLQGDCNSSCDILLSPRISKDGYLACVC